jgi:lipopolysaccharide export LptBFGC system permease protein LptF
VALALAALPFVLTTDRSRVFQRVCLAIMAAGAYEVAARGAAAYVGAFLGGWAPPAAFAAFGCWKLAKIET